MSDELPEGWATARMSALGQLHCGQSPSAARTNDHGDGTLYVSGPDQWSSGQLRLDKWTTDPKRLVPDGCIFVTVKGAGVGTTFPGVRCAIGRDIYAFEPHAGLSREYIHLALDYDIQRVIERAAGLIPGLTKEHILEQEVPVPPIGEQNRIVAKVQALLARVGLARKRLAEVPSIMKHLRQAVLTAACSGRLTEHWRENEGDRGDVQRYLTRISGKRSFETEGLTECPATWSWAPLDALREHDRPIIYGIIKPGPHIPGGVPYVRVLDMKNGRIQLDELKRAAPERAAQFKRATLRSGDILISKDGTIGRVAVVPPELEGGNITQHLVRFSPHPLLNREYLVLALQCPPVQRWLTGETKGVALQGVNVEDFRRLPIPIPPAAEQQEIVRCAQHLFSLAGVVEHRVSGAAARTDNLTSAVLSKAFRGELVPTEAELALHERREYESAAALLERLREEAESATAAPARDGRRARR